MLIKVLGAALAIFTFSILLEAPKKYLWCAGCVGAIGWFVFLISDSLGASVIVATFISALTIALVSHIFARVFKAPVTVFLIAGILPTVPGTGMYRIVYYFIAGDSKSVNYYFTQTLETAGMIAIAIFIMDTIFKVIRGKKWRQNSLMYKEKEETNVR